MKIQTTKKELIRNYGTQNALAIGYCDAWHLLRGAGVEPFACCSGVYGWNFDAYEVDGVLICTGYRGMIGKQAENVKKYENKALEIMENYTFNKETYKKDQQRQKQKIKGLLSAFIKENFKK